MDPDFEFQLRCQAQESDKKVSEGTSASSLSDASGTYTDPQDGTVYEWDRAKKAWFPKIDENFIAVYQASYGMAGPPTSSTLEAKKVVCSVGAAIPATLKALKTLPDLEDDNDLDDQLNRNPRMNKKMKKAQEEKGFLTIQKAKKEIERRKAQDAAAAWFEITDDHNRNVYVSNLPLDTAPEELLEIMSKCGIIMTDPRTNLPKIKMYKDAEGKLKGDALCTYMKLESVPLALQILDGYRINNAVLKVEKAKFNIKGEFDPEKAKQQKLKKNEKKRMQKAETKMLDWRPEKLPGIRPKHEKVVVIKNMFDPKEFEEDPSLILEFKKDLQLECENFGQVKKVVLHDRHPEGVATIGFAEFDQASACIARMNGRWFAGRQLSATVWDGKSSYKIEETEEEEKKRLGQWETFLDGSTVESEPNKPASE